MSAELEEAIRSAEILVVGAGGIGCELLKNLVFTGFKNIKLVDFDTIDVSNLNRQFLFQRQHIGKSKAQVAAEAAKEFCPDVNIVCYHKSITDCEFDVSFFKSFTFVMNALDNRAARNHVNRLCLAAEVPLIESGSSGYLGQVTLIRKGVTECYECQPKAPQKTFPGCTIRNTPSEPIHCIVWAKHLFNQLFGEADPDEDVSPDVADPELAGASVEIPKETDVVNHESEQNGNNNVENRNGNNGVKFLSRVSTRKWALDCGYDPEALYQKFFVDDILYLLSMANLWKKRTPPKPLDFDSVTDDELSNDGSSLMADQRIWSTRKCRDVFMSSVQQLRQRLGGMPESDVLVWDKDDDVCMDFVTACANIRCTIFSIPNKSRFETKSMAGNIIAAIATTNAIIAGLIVVESLKMLTNRFSSCCTVVVKLDTTTFTVKSLEEKVLKSSLHMVAPDVEIDDNKGTIIISSEEGDIDDALSSKHLADLKVLDGCRLKCDDFKQQFDLTLIIVHSSDLPKDVEFLILNDISEVKASEEPEAGTSTAGNVADDDDEVIFSEECDASEEVSTKKRKFEVVDEGVEEISSPKRAAR